jgi:hypothetical protein
MTNQTISLNIGQEAHRLAMLTRDENHRLEKAVLHLLAEHVGRDNLIGGQAMLFELQAQGFKINETRYFREAINRLRKEQWPIGSTGGIKGGYWLCKSWSELEAVLGVQFHDFAMDLLEQEKAMRQGAAKMWGPQMSFIG